MKGLISTGRLELINGGMCMHDEATVHYIDMIDQTTLGHRFIKEEFGQIPRIGWQIDPFGHSAVQAYLLGTEVGFDAFYFFRIDYQDRDTRKGTKELEVVWRGSKTFGSSADVSDLFFSRLMLCLNLMFLNSGDSIFHMKHTFSYRSLLASSQKIMNHLLVSFTSKLMILPQSSR